MQYSDETFTDIFATTRVIAIVGASPKVERPSHYVGVFLQACGYRVIGVNPGQAGTEMFGEKVYASLSDIDAPVDMIDIFRRSDHVGPIVEEALQVLPELRTVWMQLGVTHEAATRMAEAKGGRVVQNRCPKIEYPRLMGRAGALPPFGA